MVSKNIMIKNILIILTILILIYNCASTSNGPNYNVGKTHNESVANRMGIVYKQDRKMKKSMEKCRRRARPKDKKRRLKRSKEKYIK